jgi:hypothetical protein
MEPAETEISDNIFIMGYDHFATVLEDKEKIEEGLAKRHGDAKKQI